MDATVGGGGAYSQERHKRKSYGIYMHPLKLKEPKDGSTKALRKKKKGRNEMGETMKSIGVFSDAKEGTDVLDIVGGPNGASESIPVE